VRKPGGEEAFWMRGVEEAEWGMGQEEEGLEEGEERGVAEKEGAEKGRGRVGEEGVEAGGSVCGASPGTGTVLAIAIRGKQHTSFTVSNKNCSLCHHWPKLAVSYAILNLVIILRIGHNFVTL